ncbi:hypothetical protein [Neisseria iguanae]|uniref:hypothetical protein n=1 Tax=Neisseria iguanae TaxID=90242 RepID=UPI0011B24F39|nr:hypothetical protein [Neisseria iguanae]
MHQQNCVLPDRLDRQRSHNRMQENHSEQQRKHNGQLQNLLDRQCVQNRQMQQCVGDSHNRSILVRDRMKQQRHRHQVCESSQRRHPQPTATYSPQVTNRICCTDSPISPNCQMPVRSPRSDSLRTLWKPYGS